MKAKKLYYIDRTVNGYQIIATREGDPELGNVPSDWVFSDPIKAKEKWAELTEENDKIGTDL